VRRLGIAFIALSIMAGCGGSAGGVGQTAAERLGPEVEQIKAAVTSANQTATTAKLAELRATVADLRQRNQLSSAGAARILAAVAEVEARLGTPTSVQTPQTTTTGPPAEDTPRSTTRPQTPADEGKDRGKGKGGD